jgi:hypothetical protein
MAAIVREVLAWTYDGRNLLRDLLWQEAELILDQETNCCRCTSIRRRTRGPTAQSLIC